MRDLRSIASNKGLRGYYKLKTDELVTLSLEQPGEEMPTPSPRARGEGKKVRALCKNNLKPSRNGWV